MGGNDFYSKLKVNKTIELEFDVNTEFFKVRTQFPLKIDQSKIDKVKHDYHPGDIASNSIFLILKNNHSDSYCELIAKIIQADEFKNELQSAYGTITFQFLLEEEEEKKFEKSKSSDWKTL